MCRVAVCSDRFSDSLTESIGKQSLADYRNTSASFVIIQEAAQKLAKELFHEQDFIKWRAQNEKSFLKEKRAEEKTNHQYPKPYIDYFDRQELQMFRTFWEEFQWDLLLALLKGHFPKDIIESQIPYFHHFLLWHAELAKGAHAALPWISAYKTLQASIKNMPLDTAKEYLHTLRGYQDLNRPLLGYYSHLSKEKGIPLEKNLARAFYPMHGYGYGRSQAYRQASTQGSIFKLVIAYESLKQRYEKLDGQNITLNSLNPLTIVDQIFKRGKETCVGYHQDGRPIPLYYNGGRMLKSHTGNIGKIDLIKALENSSNPYFSLLAAEVLESPNDLAKVSQNFSYGKRTGIELPGEITGKVPNDLETNRTGLYAMANGQHTLVVTPLQTSVMLATIANGGYVLKPNIVSLTVGHSFLVADKLSSQKELFNQPQIIKKFYPQIQRQIFMPDIIRNILLIGMRKVVLKQLTEGLTSLSRFYHEYPEAIADYLELKNEIAGKTSTAEAVENIDLDFYEGTNVYTHVWFGGIAFDKEISNNTQTLLYLDQWGNPELVVVVYLKYGAWGKESAPLGAQMIKKWREIKAAKEKSG